MKLKLLKLIIYISIFLVGSAFIIFLQIMFSSYKNSIKPLNDMHEIQLYQSNGTFIQGLK